MGAESDYFENPIQVDKGRLGKPEQGPIDIATPRRRPCIPYAARLGASEGPCAKQINIINRYTVQNILVFQESFLKEGSGEQGTNNLHMTMFTELCPYMYSYRDRS